MGIEAQYLAHIGCSLGSVRNVPRFVSKYTDHIYMYNNYIYIYYYIYTIHIIYIIYIIYIKIYIMFYWRC